MNLDSFRKEINKIDEQLVRLLARRKTMVLNLWEWKKKNKIPLLDPKREKKIIIRAKKLAKLLKLDSDVIEKLFRQAIKSNK